MPSINQENDKDLYSQIAGKIISPSDKSYEKFINYWATSIENEAKKGLIPLFITGSGTSMDAGVPSIWGIIDYLMDIFQKERNSTIFPEIHSLFEKYREMRSKNKSDRTIVAHLLNSFQENDQLKKKEWRQLNNWLLDKILKSKPRPFHENLSSLYKQVNAICMTLNFDGLLIRHFVENGLRAFSIPNEHECETYFLRQEYDSERAAASFIEIQVRGDILYVKCQSDQFCPNRVDDKKHSLWANIGSVSSNNYRELLNCPYCGEQGLSFLSFPGSYDKEREMQSMLAIVWRYLAFRVASVTVIGLSGEWDPLIVAFLGGLLSEREVPLLVVDKFAKENTHIVKELVSSGRHYSPVLRDSADNFMTRLSEQIERGLNARGNIIDISFDQGITDDQYWYKIIEGEPAENSINEEFSSLEMKLRNELKDKEKLINFAQLGLKSYWLLGASKTIKHHNRYNHSIGVMKIASYLYDKALKNSNIKPNVGEKQFLRLAALLHDVGHLPFSHLIENVFNELGWRPEGYKESYSHVFHTDDRINELSRRTALSDGLHAIGYTVSDLINLVNGRFGIGFLDSIINSPVDADKIDYVFRDTDSTKKKIPLSPKSFLGEIGSQLYITPEKMLSFSGDSARAARDLLKTRIFIYENLYLQPGIIVLEGIVKLIIRTFFVHKIRVREQLGNMKHQLNHKREYSDLGHHKIRYSIDSLLDLVESASNRQRENSDVGNIELSVLEMMFEQLKNDQKYFNETFFENFSKGFELVKRVDNEDKLKTLEGELIYKRFLGNENELKEIIKDVRFRIPGAAIIETCRLPNALSIAESRKVKARGDGTKEFSECILVPKGNHDLWDATQKASIPITVSSLLNLGSEHISVFFYPLSGSIDGVAFKQCYNLFKRFVMKKGISSEIQ